MRKVLTISALVAALALVCVSSALAGGSCPPPPPKGPKCDTKKGTVYLDQAAANVNHNDGKVTFCHATSSAKNPFVVITTSTSACRAHDTHTKQPKGGSEDVFATGGCRD